MPALDLTLPATAPAWAPYLDKPGDGLPAAVYTLVNLSDADLAELVEACESGCIDTGGDPGDCVKLAPEPRFVGRPLRDVFDAHLELVPGGKYEPFYFIVAVDKDWKEKGVLLVGHDRDDELYKCTVDSFKIKAEDSGLAIVNLQIANVNWGEEKENALEGADDEDDEGDEDE